MIHANRIVTVGEQECIIDRPIVLYRGDREVEIEFTLVGNEFTFSEEGNVIKSVNASHGQLVLNTPSGEHMFSELAECHEGKVVFVVTKEMIDEFIEMGFYSFQIRLYDSAEMKSRVTIPPVMNGFDIRNPIAAEDETNVVDQGLVDYARVFKDQSDEELPTFTWGGEYVKTEWAHHDVITENKMNKIEDALYSINANVKESDVAMLNALDNVKKDADKYVKEYMAEVEADVDEFERNINTGVEKFKVDTNAAMTAHKNEVNEELESVNSQLTHKVNKNHVNVVDDFGAVGDGQSDDTEAIQKAINYCLESISKNNIPYPNEYIDTVIIPKGRYKITNTITTYPQVKIVCDGFVQLESYIYNGSCIHLTYPTHLGDLLGCDYRGLPIDGSSGGLLITNKYYTGKGNTDDQYWGGENIGLDLGTYEKDLKEFSDKQMVARYILENIQLVGFKTGIRLNASSHFMGRYNNLRICFSNDCVQVGEFLNQNLGTSIENFSFNDCLFERSNNVVRWVRNATSLIFNDCSFDYIRADLMVADCSGSRRILFNGGHIEKIANNLYNTTYDLNYEGYNINIKFNGVELHLKHGKLFNINGGRCLVDFDNCIWVRDEYYTTSDVEAYVANNKKIGDERTHITTKNLRVYYSNGCVQLGDNSNCFYDSSFSLTEGSSLKTVSTDYIKGFSSHRSEGVENGTYSLWDFGTPIAGWELDKQINFKIGSDVDYGNITLTTNDIKANSLNLSTNFLVRCNDYTSTSLEVTVKCYNINRELVKTEYVMLDNTSKWKDLHANKWCMFSPFVNTSTCNLHPTTDYITITYKLNSSNANATFALTGFSVEFL